MSQWALFALIGIAVVELFAFGPLSKPEQQTRDQWTGVALMVALPLAAAAIALWRQQRQA